ILKHLYKNRSFGYITVRVYLHLQQDIDDSIPNYLRNVNPLIDILTQATRISELVGLQFPKNVPRYLDNLTSMGLIRVISDRHHISTEYDHLIEMYKGVIKSYELSPTTRKVEIKKGYFEISEMGSMFGLACNLSEITSDVETYESAAN
ncbi:MAG: Abi-alpha family protein, partial [Candidatus Promineifilaceae bacterium]